MVATSVEVSVPQEVSAVLNRTYREKFPGEIITDNELPIQGLPASLLEHPIKEQADYLELFLGPDGLNLHNSENLAHLLTDVVNTPLRVRTFNPTQRLPILVSEFGDSLKLPALKYELNHGGWERSYYGEKFQGALVDMENNAGNYKREWELRFAKSLGKAFARTLWPAPHYPGFEHESANDFSNAAGWEVVADLMDKDLYKSNPLRPLLDIRLAGFQPIGFRTAILGIFNTIYEPQNGGLAPFRVRAPEATSF
ncbi:MAG: hypothetical protein Q7R49_03295 [Candidatus Daviesbacteria bacterium]|nr:hypothetical protein [Candidatus Daviesbacteria bacterium]